MKFKKSIIIFIHAFIGWVLCGLTMAVGSSVTSMENTLIIHVVAVPIIFVIISWNYFKRFHYTSPLVTALIFLSFILVVDFFVVAMLIQKNFNMFKSFIGTWLPFIFIFVSTFATGYVSKKCAKN